MTRLTPRLPGHTPHWFVLGMFCAGIVIGYWFGVAP